MAKIYTHYKHKKSYTIELIVKNGTNNAPDNQMMVVYRSIESGEYHVRPYDEFFGTVVWNGVEQPRYTFMYESDLL